MNFVLMEALLNISFAHPGFLWMLLLLVPMIIWYLARKEKKRASLQVSSLRGFEGKTVSWRHHLRHLLFVFRLMAVTLLIMILARPQSSEQMRNVTTEGIDIVMAIDVSSSMLARDFKPDRLEASKNVATEFIAGRPADRIGLVVFSGESFTQCPLTTDHAVVTNLLREVKSGIIEDGTAIGMGLANAINRLKESSAISKVVILLTDGVNNMGEVDPLTAAEIAGTFGIRLYTIGVGSRGMAPYPVNTPYGIQMRNMEVEIDEEMLQRISDMTDGRYFRATDIETLREIYAEIDKLEKSKIDVTEYSKKEEEYPLFALFALLFVFAELILQNTFLRTAP